MGSRCDFASAIGWQSLPLTGAPAAAELAQPLAHEDPFDGLLLVQEEGLRLPTRDAKRLGHPFAIGGRDTPQD